MDRPGIRRAFLRPDREKGARLAGQLKKTDKNPRFT